MTLFRTPSQGGRCGRRSACAPLVALAALAILPGCAGTAGGQSGEGADVITASQIAESGASNAYEVIDRLRPRWLRVRMDRSSSRDTEIVVFVGTLQMSGLDALWDIDARNVRSIRWLDSAQAGMLPGLGSRHVEGAIMIETR